jgi:hypothetical protein
MNTYNASQVFARQNAKDVCPLNGRKHVLKVTHEVLLVLMHEHVYPLVVPEKVRHCGSIGMGGHCMFEPLLDPGNDLGLPCVDFGGWTRLVHQQRNVGVGEASASSLGDGEGGFGGEEGGVEDRFGRRLGGWDPGWGNVPGCFFFLWRVSSHCFKVINKFSRTTG